MKSVDTTPIGSPIMIRNVMFLLGLSLIACLSYAQTAGDYLILQDIDRYKLTKGIELRGRILGAEPSVTRMGDAAQGYYISYGTRYVGGTGYAVPNVEVRVYDSTQWMLHELERDIKNRKEGVATTTNIAAATEPVDNYPVIVFEVSGGSYRWISGNKAIILNYRDANFQYPIPMEVISAYLKKYPSTLPATYQIRHPDREKEFIREEFDYHLWVADRCVSLIQEADPKRNEKLKDAAKHLEEFAKYRKTYFSNLLSFLGNNMDADIELLQHARMRADLETIVRTKLAEYKEWWAEHKTDEITFP